VSRLSPAASRTMSITHPSRRRALTMPTAYLGTSAPWRGADSAHLVRTGRSSIFLTPAKLDAFVAVAEDGGFSAATRRLHISQPALSQTVNAIERQSGLKLLPEAAPAYEPPINSGQRKALSAPTTATATTQSL
jgi:hypothetical protein